MKVKSGVKKEGRAYRSRERHISMGQLVNDLANTRKLHVG